MKNMSIWYARQGDLLLAQVATLPTGLLEVESKVILNGETTGHKHQVKSSKLFRSKKSLTTKDLGLDGFKEVMPIHMFIKVGKTDYITHEEHAPTRLEKGYYAVIRQREYTSENMTKLVVD